VTNFFFFKPACRKETEFCLTKETAEETSRNAAQAKERSPSLTTGEVIHTDSSCSMGKNEEKYQTKWK
jgi:hypothetical protein